MTQTVPATCVLGPGMTGLTIGLRVLNLDGTVYAAFSTSSVAETSTAGTYRKAGGVVAPLAGGYIVWGTALVDYAEATVESAAANVTYRAGVAVAAADGNGNDPVVLADAAHGGSSATLVLKSIVVSNTDNAGRAIILRGGNPGSAGYPVDLLSSAGSAGGGIIYGSINNVTSGVIVGGAGISGTAFDESALQAIRDTGKLAPTAGDPAAGSIDKHLDDAATAAAVADVPEMILLHDWTTLTGVIPDRSTLNALRFLRNKWTATGGELTVYEEDDETEAWTALLTTNSSADRITGTSPE